MADNVPGRVLIRDSKLGNASPVLAVSPAAFAATVDAVKGGRFDG